MIPHPGAPDNHACAVRSVLTAPMTPRPHTLSTMLDYLGERVVLFRYGEFVFVTFGLFACLGAAVSLTGTGAILIGQGLSPALFVLLALGGSAAIVIGSWLLGQLLDYRLVLTNPRAALRRPVFVSWGGLLAIPLVLAIIAPLSGFHPLLLLDALARTVPLGHALGRLGCLTYGCCFGQPTSLRFAITYRNPLAKAVRVAGLQSVPLHPAPFYEAVLDLGILLVVTLAAARGAPVGVPSVLALLLYSLGRFAIEFLRDNDGRMVLGALSLNHFVCLMLAALSAVGLPVVVLMRTIGPAISWTAAATAVPGLALTVGPCALLVFVGFSLHRGRVGAW